MTGSQIEERTNVSEETQLLISSQVNGSLLIDPFDACVMKNFVQAISLLSKPLATALELSQCDSETFFNRTYYP